MRHLAGVHRWSEWRTVGLGWAAKFGQTEGPQYVYDRVRCNPRLMFLAT